ncbi:MAG: primosome assembly protein PriA [Dermatophilaceae bacterium]
MNPEDTARASTAPVAAVLVDSGLAHLDRAFEYAVPPQLQADAVAGVRVRVRFAGRDVGGFVVRRLEQAQHPGPLSPLRRVVSPEPVLTPQVLALCQATAQRYAGVLGDVLRLAVPPRHAAAERALAAQPPAMEALAPPDPGPWTAYPAGASFLRHVSKGEAPGAAWLALPSQPPERDWPRAMAVAAATAISSGRGAVLVVPDRRDVDRVDDALTRVLGRGRHVRLTAEQGPQARYTAWLKVLRGHVPCVVGNRAAAFAPVRDLGLVAWWDDGDDLLREPRAPYPHMGEVLRMRAEQGGVAMLAGGFTPSVEVQQLVEQGVLADVRATARAVRAAAPRVVVAGEGPDPERDGAAAHAHLPPAAWRAAKAALDTGPVLVQVPRRGYLPSLSCDGCREPVRCAHCHGPVAVAAPGAGPRCRWCESAFETPAFQCPECQGTRVRSSVVGARRTAEEIGRAFPGTRVLTSGSGQVHATVAAAPALVIATPGAEPVADEGYAATLLLDAWALLDRAELDAPVEALRRWTAAAALTRPSADGGVVVLGGAPSERTLPAVEALVRWDPAWLAARELAERAELGLPPTVRMAQLVGSRRAVEAALGELDPALTAGRLGPLPLPLPAPGGQGAGSDRPAQVQVLLRVPADRSAVLAEALLALRTTRSARKDPEPLTIRMDPAAP